MVEFGPLVIGSGEGVENVKDRQTDGETPGKK